MRVSLSTVNQMFGTTSQLPTTTEHAVIKSDHSAQFRQHSQKLEGADEHVIDGSKKRICRVPQPRCLRIRQTPFQPSTTILTVALVFITSLFHGTRWKTKITVIKKCSHENGEIYRKTKRNETRTYTVLLQGELR